MKTVRLALILSGFLFSTMLYSQASAEYTGGMKVKLNEEGTKYVRIISWAQFWAQNSSNAADNASSTNLSVRRARVLLFSQISKDFLILLHFGSNSLNANNLTPIGVGSAAQTFFHDIWVEYKLDPKLYVGGGLHYWNGISRLNNQSTLNMLTMDNNRQAWATLGLSDQFARHIGVYAKGSLGKLNYRVSINNPLTNSLQAGQTPVAGGPAVYVGRQLLGSKDAGVSYSGYFDYNFLDKESNFLPFMVGTYLGKKKIFNIGAGFFSNPNGSVVFRNNQFIGENVGIFGIDAFYDAPVGGNGAAITALAMFQSSNYGTDYTLGQTYATGNMFYSHVGYLIPSTKKVKYQPYASINSRSIDAINNNASIFGIGANVYLNGNNSKLTFDYSSTKYGDGDPVGRFTIQAMVYL